MTCLQEINNYIQNHCVCDGLGPLDGMSDIGNFEGLTQKDLEKIIYIYLSKAK